MIIAMLLTTAPLADAKISPQSPAPLKVAPAIAAGEDIESLLMWLMMQVSKDAEADVRAALNDARTTAEEKERLRQQMASMKAEQERLSNAQTEARERAEAVGFFTTAKKDCGKSTTRAACLIGKLSARTASLKQR